MCIVCVQPNDVAIFYVTKYYLSKLSKAFNEAMKRWNEIQRKKIMGKRNIGPLKNSLHHQIYWQRYQNGWRGVKLGLNI
jgi:hypothetical protein